ncbi:hypothetical protein M5689_020888 [Euphorbia peplus]|nr:hypothetical protein M5689_020888 [Euphorbia peplus]
MKNFISFFYRTSTTFLQSLPLQLKLISSPTLLEILSSLDMISKFIVMPMGCV